MEFILNTNMFQHQMISLPIREIIFYEIVESYYFIRVIVNTKNINYVPKYLEI